jgi:hypothetical protein
MSNFGAFYYSEKQEKVQSHSHDCYFKDLFGRVRVYSEWVSKFPFICTSKWEDKKFLGFGWYDHVEKNGNPYKTSRDWAS